MAPDQAYIPISFVVAVARNGVIGRDGDLPWRISSDLKMFRDLTMGKPVVMGRTTYQSIGKPLDGRTNIVVTRNDELSIDGAVVVTDLEEAIARARDAAAADDNPEIMVIGGAQVYEALMERADRLYVTEVQLDPAGDARFPAISPEVWGEKERTSHPKGPKDDASFDFVIYERKSA